MHTTADILARRAKRPRTCTMDLSNCFRVAVLLLMATAIKTENSKMDCENDVSTKSPLCSELYQAIEAALIHNEAALFNLRKIFFPPSEIAPTLVNISFVLTLAGTPDTPCPEAGKNATFMNASGVTRETFGWTTNNLYKIIHPATLNRLQPQLFYQIMKEFEFRTSHAVEAEFYWEGVGPYLTVELALELRNLTCTPSLEQLSNTMRDMTTAVSDSTVVASRSWYI